MIDMPVTLIVKAPNQQVEDQKIHCELNWTIRKLKGYLSEVYPSKPRTEDQKLIYSGQLLHDSVTLKDILRRYEGQEAHTVHLVCTPSRDLVQHVSTVVTRAPSRMHENGQLSTNSSRDPRAFWAGAVANPYASTPGYDPNSMSQQMLWMQQAYAHYVTQYMQMMASAGVPQSWYPSSHTAVQVSIPQHGPEHVQAPPVNLQEQPPVQPNNINVADGAEEEEEGRGNRDWLDWFYTMSRVMVLFSIVYFYSSPTRFVIVSALGLVLYLLIEEPQKISHKAQVVENNNLQNQNDGMGAVAGAEIQGQQRLRREDSGAEEPDPEPDRPSLFALTWTFFTSFFASLIPEQPGAL
ncbi:hypothetical protein L798_12908 [Zootermopsis nevadensis]|uniref:Homocysteine-responsive endoplasmic reticulum-resident ubiquitin-like domain member 2 protein n=1 Tax=Zootermopsis nevadensis TaxID=136037 RepID=A0A067QTA3_ZOONE|nr:hypothetical protein L798_12908 [Zootermopsis nevadensis]